MTTFQARVVAVVLGLGPGDVLTYAEVAQEAGHPGAGQAVANVLRRVEGLPWWRVVPTGGRLWRSHLPVQGPLLRRDGVVVDEERHVVPPGSDRPRSRPRPGGMAGTSAT
jgi:methylated-DNA-protein-cysteine methyltransferase related protein